MSTLSKYLSSFVGGLKPNRISARTLTTLELPPPEQAGGMPLSEALKLRRSQREFSPTALPKRLLSNLLWSAGGINRADTGGRTIPSALNAQEVDVYVALASGVYVYDAKAHALRLVAQLDARRVTGYQDFVDHAPVDLVYVADYAHVPSWSEQQRLTFSAASAGAMAQNVYLYAASAGLVSVVRAWFDRASLGEALNLSKDERVLLAQTVGYPADDSQRATP
jgi:SagB-type dehydrogenase family enzyme